MGVELREVRDHFNEYVDRVEHHRERVTVTRNGRPVAVLINPEDLAELEETLDVLCDPQTLADIRQGDLAYVAGDVVRGAAAVTNLRR
jgi:antitoxin YefM